MTTQEEVTAMIKDLLKIDRETGHVAGLVLLDLCEDLWRIKLAQVWAA